jgi:hypothetical protein
LTQGGRRIANGAMVKKRVTRKMVNDALRERGRDESLREGEGYFYFGGGEAVNWLSPTVMVKKLSDLSLEEWLKEFDRILENEKKIQRPMRVAEKKKPLAKGKPR